MIRSSLNRFQYFPVVALTLSLLVGGYYYDKTLDNWVTNIVSTYMSNIIDDVSHQIQDKNLDLYDMSQPEIDSFLDTLSQSSFEQRFTIIHSSGEVLGDSQLNNREIARLDDHSRRQEFVSALSGEIGISKRFSQSLNQELLYVAKKLELPEDGHGHDSTYILRLAMPMTSVYAMSADLKFIEHVLMACSVLILVISTWVSHRKLFRMVQAERDQQEYRIQKSTQEIELLHQLANMLAACNTVKEAQIVVADIIPRVLGNVNGCVSIMRDSRNQLEVKLDWGGEWPASKLYAPNDCWALRKGKYHLSKEKHHNLSCNHMNQASTDGLTLCIPLTAHGNTVGMFHLYFDDQTGEISEDIKQLSFTIAEHLGLALANLSLQEKLRSQAMRDPLTGLFNRRYFEEIFEKEWAKAAQDNSPISLLMLDLDHFKRFNDNFGHDAGDYVLKEVANLLKREIGDEHVACRLGGEELAVICPSSSVDESMELANHIVDSVRDLHLDMKGLSLGQLGVSIGVTTFPELNTSTTELIKAADTALYQAKNNGRSQAVHTQSKSYLKQQNKDSHSDSPDVLPLKL
ncbi:MULTISPECIES: sensor domain-containing diguanylate cyclase [Vibrio]|uniref:sensor domain-containing diguanylate cyclase n=1 Tax=Vibrio TaxID=662 RepID=UPI002074F2BB|nr:MULTISPECIES: diguanylate cyclase [Vibrio]USD35048.1 diguanylate cyclase [Vibrio sp. SCSIO 43186]USD48113.1 diguanylate cyclase [Vibrio sp. SCSIO 43145]USD72173.1 diguanylate cyclase [Vibrio sp. SCSIO 43139]USD97845.1 diguanylate cyclase [Vibrio coralliilyticus]